VAVGGKEESFMLQLLNCVVHTMLCHADLLKGLLVGRSTCTK